MKDILIAVDTGKHSTKALINLGQRIEKVVFRTKVQEVHNLGVDITPNSYLVDFNGKSYLIGNMVSESQSDYSISKSSITHQLSIYVAIAKLIDKADVMKFGLPNVHLAINLPINIYKNNTLKIQYQNMIQKDKEVITLKINGIIYCFRITNIVLMPEAVGSTYYRPTEFRDTKATVIDIGSLNTTFCTYKNLIPELESMVVANSGISILRAKLAETLKSKYGIHIDDNDTEEILKDGCLYINGNRVHESIEIINELINNHVLEIFNFAKSRNITFNNSKLVFVGGGSILLQDYILTHYPSAIIEENSQLSNALSYLKVLEIKHNGKK
ncbi:ParM/StbA family protein [Clostridium sp.]|uniref:ParM/StbA family protein n=1 Tax=Clostridium sp. TaxID=1506 RepID=UPI002FC9C65C